MSDRSGLLQRLTPAFLVKSTNGNGNGKPLTAMVHSGRGSVASMLFDSLLPGMMLPGTKNDYAKEVGDGLGSSVLAAPLNFIMRTFPEAPPIVEARKEQLWEEDPKHKLTALLKRPNPFYSGRILWMATVLDFSFGEAFWLKIRNANDEVIQLWWVPRQTMTPKWPTDGKTFIEHYDYRPGSAGGVPIDPRDVVHMRFGIDPRNNRRGLSPLGALARDIVTDDTAATFTSTILKNLGIIGIVISPKVGSTAPRKEDALEALKKYIKEKFTGDNRGDALALGAPTEAQLLQYNMQGFDVSPIRDVSEERVCAALGIPAAVIGFGTGLQQTKVGATMKEMRQLAWTGGIIPMQEIIADEIERSLMPEFETSSADVVRMRFDTSKVRALWEDTNEKHDRIRKDYLAGFILRSEARRETGRTAAATDEVYAQPVNVIQLSASGEPIPAPTDPNAPAPPKGVQVDVGGSTVHNTMPEIKQGDVHVSVTIPSPKPGTKTVSTTRRQDDGTLLTETETVIAEEAANG